MEKSESRDVLSVKSIALDFGPMIKKKTELLTRRRLRKAAAAQGIQTSCWWCGLNGRSR